MIPVEPEKPAEKISEEQPQPARKKPAPAPAAKSGKRTEKKAGPQLPLPVAEPPEEEEELPPEPVFLDRAMQRVTGIVEIGRAHV